MSLLRHIRDNQATDSGYHITPDQMRRLRLVFVAVRRMLFSLMREFKRWADPCHIPTRWSKPYRAAKAYFADRTKK